MRGTRKIDWLNHILEFIVVIIGILIAFQLNTCRESSQEQHLVDQHLGNIIAETELNKGMIQYNIRNSEGTLKKVDSLLNRLKQDEKDVAKINALAMNLMAVDYTYIRKNAYNSLVETGDIRFIKSLELQNDIIGLYEYYSWIEGVGASTRATYAEQYFPFVVENLDLIDYKAQDISIYDNKLFKNYLSVYRYSVSYRLQKQKDGLEVIDSFLSKVKE